MQDNKKFQNPSTSNQINPGYQAPHAKGRSASGGKFQIVWIIGICILFGI